MTWGSPGGMYVLPAAEAPTGGMDATWLVHPPGSAAACCGLSRHECAASEQWSSACLTLYSVERVWWWWPCWYSWDMPPVQYCCAARSMVCKTWWCAACWLRRTT